MNEEFIIEKERIIAESKRKSTILVFVGIACLAMFIYLIAFVNPNTELDSSIILEEVGMVLIVGYMFIYGGMDAYRQITGTPGRVLVSDTALTIDDKVYSFADITSVTMTAPPVTDATKGRRRTSVLRSMSIVTAEGKAKYYFAYHVQSQGQVNDACPSYYAIYTAVSKAAGSKFVR